MASNLVAMAPQPTNNGLQPTSDGLQLVMASDLIAMPSNLLAMASNGGARPAPFSRSLLPRLGFALVMNVSQYSLRFYKHSELGSLSFVRS